MSYWTKKQKEEGTAVNMRSKETVAEVLNYPILAVKERNISKETCEKYGVRTALSEKDGKTPVAHYFPYYDQQGKLSGFKKRDLTLEKHDKFHYTTIGKVGVDCKLFGQDVAEHVERRRVNVLYKEGEWDVLSGYQSLTDSVKGGKYDGLEPFIVGLNCGTTHAAETTLHNKAFVTSFDSVTLAFDNDSSTPKDKEKGIRRGQEAKEDVAACLIGEGVGLFYVQYPDGVKDSSDMLQDGKSAELAKLLQFGKKPYSTEKIVRASEISFEDVIKPKPYGILTKVFPKLDNKIRGFRTGELVLVTAPSGVGKTTVTDIFSNRFVEEGEKVGKIFLEETVIETFQRTVASKLKVNFNEFRLDPLKLASEDAIKKAYDEVVDNNSLVFLDHFGSLAVGELMGKIKHMHLVEGCRYILLDHISLLISGIEVADERKELDVVMTMLSAYCAANDVCLIVVSHVNRTAAEGFKPPKGKEDEAFWVRITKEMLRGSSALEGLSFIILGLEPEILPDRSRGRVRIVVLKNRPVGYLGVADTFTMDNESWQITLSEDETVVDF